MSIPLAPQDPFTAVDAREDIGQTLVDAGFDVLRSAGQHVVYRMPNGDRFTVFVSKQRGK